MTGVVESKTWHKSPAKNTLQEAYQLFVTADKDRKGKIDAAQLAEALAPSLPLTVERAASLLKVADGDEDARLNFAEFYSVYACMKVLVRHFDVQDLTKLTKQDVKFALQSVGLNPNEAQVGRMLAIEQEVQKREKKSGYHVVEEVELEQFLRIYLKHSQPDDARPPSAKFLHMWYLSSARQPTDFPKPPEVSPSQDFVAGTFAGVALTLVGHPFDTVKVRLQTGQFNGAMDVVAKTLNKENILAFYKGMGGPMLTIPFINAIVFGAYSQGKKWCFDSLEKRGTPAKTEEDLPLWMISLAGAYSGFMSCFIACPVELIKTRIQIQYSYASESERFRGPLDAVRRILYQNNLKGLYRGMSATIYREVPGYAAQFYLYEKLKRYFSAKQAQANGGERKPLGAGPLIISGGLAGIFGWVMSYPMDYIKSQIQAEPFDKKTPYKKNPYLLDGGFFSCLKFTVDNHGWKALWRGFVPCVARAFPANGAGFLAYELALKFIQDLDSPSP